MAAHTGMSPQAAGAAVSLIVFSMVGVATMSGLLPAANSEKAEFQVQAAPTAPVAPHAARKAPRAVQTGERSSLTASPSCTSCGTVEVIRVVELKGEASGLGAVAGGVAGAVIGNQMGSGRGNTAMTVIGAAGGAFAGHEIERNAKKHQTWPRHAWRTASTIRSLSRNHRCLPWAPGSA